MLSNGSINLSNVSPAESSVPLLIPHPPTLAAPAMLLRTTQSMLTTNTDIDAKLLRTIANGLLTTIANQETDTTHQYHRFTEQIKSLQDRIIHYEETFEQAPDGYVPNDRHIPHFRIPCGNGLSRPAKWIKLNDDGTVSGYADTDGPNNMPLIIDLYAESNDQYDDEGETKPTLPILPWFRYLMVGPSTDFQLLHNALLINDNWGLTCKVHWYRDLDTEYADTCVKLKCLQVKLDAIQLARSSCKSHLQLAHPAEQVEKLQNIPHKPQASRTAWKHKTTGCGCPN